MKSGNVQSDIDVVLKNLEQARARQGVLLEKLKISIRMKQAWPEAFKDDCTCRPYVKGRARRGLNKTPTEVRDYSNDGEFYLRRSDGFLFKLTQSDLIRVLGENA